jgi:hypothetical protein
VSLNGVGCIVHQTGPLIIGFLFFHLDQICKLFKPHFCNKKFIKLCTLMECRIRNNFPFGSKFKFEREFNLKILEAKLLLNLDQIYWGFKPV